MTSKLKCPVCPYCNKPLHCGAELNVDGHNIEMWCCTNYACEQSEDLIGTREMWEIVKKYEQSQKNLEKAIGAFEYILEKIKISKIVDPNDITIMMIEGMCEMTLEQIEHKEQ